MLGFFKREAELRPLNILALNAPDEFIDASRAALHASLQRRRAAIVALCQDRLEEILCWHTFSGANNPQL